MGDDEGLTPGGAGHRRRLSPTPASPLENEDTLSEILLRLPPAPSSLPRASLVCKLWRGVVSDAGFLRRFRSRHRRSPPLLGFFEKGPGGVVFAPTLDPPDRIPPGCLSLQLDDAQDWLILGCCHGLVLLRKFMELQILVWDPVTGDQHFVAVPREFGELYHGAVLRASGDVNGGGHSRNFKVVLVGNNKDYTRPCAYVYSSDTGIWGNLVSTAFPAIYCIEVPSSLIGGSLYWLLHDGALNMYVLEFDLDKQCLAVTKMPLEVAELAGDDEFRFMRAEGGVPGFFLMSAISLQLWKRKTNCDGSHEWVLGKTIDLRKLLSLDLKEEFPKTVHICGFYEDDNVLLLRTRYGAFMIQLESMQFKKLFGAFDNDVYHPFACVNTAGMSIGGGQDRAEHGFLV